MIYSVPRNWEGETCAILAGGPSLKGFDPSVLDGVRVITINDAWRIRPRKSINYFCDGSWWTNQMAKNPRALDGSISFHDQIYKGFWITGAVGFHEHPQVRSVRLTGQVGLETAPTGLRTGSNSGYQALNLAYHLGVKRILLLGYDMKLSGPRTHWFDRDGENAAVFEKALARDFLPRFNEIKAPLENAGVEVINCTPDSALKVWPAMSLEEALVRQTVDA